MLLTALSQAPGVQLGYGAHNLIKSTNELNTVYMHALCLQAIFIGTSSPDSTAKEESS
jgi:hypothetical protein